jgi:hypothetical protein
VTAIRLAVRALCDAVGVDALKPQDVARRLRLNKNLTWKFARMLVEEDILDAVTMMPGPEGVAIYLRAFEHAQVDPPLVRAMRDAIDSFDAMVVRHFGARADLELALDGLRTAANLEQSRRLAYRGMSAIFGVQAAARVTSHIIVPGSDAANHDLALVVGLAGLRRLRPIPRLPVFRSTTGGVNQAQPLLPAADGADDDFLMREFSSLPNASVSRTEVDGRLTVALTEGPIGRVGEADLFFGSLSRNAYRARRTPGDSLAEFITAVSIPSESFLHDIFVHRSVEGTDTVEASMFGTLGAQLPRDDETREVVRIPIDCTPTVHEALPSEAFAELIEAASVPNYAPMMQRAFAALGQDPAEYRLIRVAMQHPPAPSALVVRWQLPE